MRNKIIAIVIIALLIGGVTFKLVKNKKIIDESGVFVDKTDVAIPVGVITTKLTSPEGALIKSGTLIPFKEADISAIGGGKLTSVNFELGDFVSKGAVLATVDSEMLRLNLEAATIARDQAKREYDRFLTLYEGNAATEQNLQNMKLQYDNAENQIQQLKKQIADNSVLAPISGQIILKLKESGEFVGPGSVIGQMVQVDKLKVGVMVSENEVYNLQKGAPVVIKTDVYPGVDFDGVVSFVSHSGDAVHNYRVEVSLENKKEHLLKAGTFAYVDFLGEVMEEAILIPKSALIESLDKPMVYVVDGDKATIKEIILGASYGNEVEVVEGLKEGDIVITSGLVNVSEGTIVDPIEH